MLSTVDVPEALEKQYENNKKLAREIAGALYGGVERRLNAEVDLLSVDDLAYVYLRGPAYFKFYHTDRLLRMFSEGDIVPVGPRYPEKYAKIICDFAADVIFFSLAKTLASRIVELNKRVVEAD